MPDKPDQQSWAQFAQGDPDVWRELIEREIPRLYGLFLQTASCVAGWREFMITLSANKARFALYLLFQIVIGIVVGAIIGIGFCVGLCLCCASCLLLIPYIGTVILLPLLVFQRAYSLYYLQQFGPRLDVFAVEAQVVQPA